MWSQNSLTSGRHVLDVKRSEMLEDNSDISDKSNGARESRTSSEKGSKAAGNTNTLQPTLQRTRSRSTQKQNTAEDSHTKRHSGDEEKQQQQHDASPHEASEFEVGFDGDDDPWNPKNNLTTARKWSIVLIGSACSFAVAYASAV